MTLTNNYAQATMKQNNTNTEYLRGRPVFVFIVNKVGPFENHFINSCFIRIFKHSKTTKTLGLRPRALISFLVFKNPDETLALSYEILHLYRVKGKLRYFLIPFSELLVGQDTAPLQSITKNQSKNMRIGRKLKPDGNSYESSWGIRDHMPTLTCVWNKPTQFIIFFAFQS